MGGVFFVMNDKLYRIEDFDPGGLGDLSEDCVRHMTESDLTVLIWHLGRELNSGVVMDELRLQQRWHRLHGSDR
jgi:hypothetical protein